MLHLFHVSIHVCSLKSGFRSGCNTEIRVKHDNTTTQGRPGTRKQLFIYYQPKQYTIHDTWEQYHLNESFHIYTTYPRIHFFGWSLLALYIMISAKFDFRISSGSHFHHRSFPRHFIMGVSLLMEEILYHTTCMKPCKQTGYLHIFTISTDAEFLPSIAWKFPSQAPAIFSFTTSNQDCPSSEPWVQ